MEIVELSDSTEHQAALLIISDGISRGGQDRVLASNLLSEFRVLVLRADLPDAKSVLGFTRELLSVLAKKRVKRLTVFGIGRGGSVALAMVRLNPKLIRRLAILDGATRVAPSVATRVIDRLERWFPFGLPLRKFSGKFDARPFLHRIHCPTLVMTSPRASKFRLSEAEWISQHIPNAWLDAIKLPAITDEGSLSKEIVTELKEFMQVPVKRPQKGKQAKKENKPQVDEEHSSAVAQAL